MAIPQTFFNLFPTWIGVYGLTSVMFSISIFLFYNRVIRHIVNSDYKLDFSDLSQRIKNVVINGIGQKKVLKRTTIKSDRSGIGHVVIFVSFLSYSLSYVLFIFGDSVNSNFSEIILGTFIKNIYLNYLEILALLVFVALVSALVRRWVLTPNRLKFSLNKKPESIIIIVLIALLMATHLLSETMNQIIMSDKDIKFHIVSTNLSKLFLNLEYANNTYVLMHDMFWWIHLIIILSFAVYIPVSKHLHLLVSPMSFFFGSTQGTGVIDTPTNLEEMESFGANNLKTFKPKQIMDFFACAVCGRCSEVCPTDITGKAL